LRIGHKFLQARGDLRRQLRRCHARSLNVVPSKEHAKSESRQNADAGG